MIAKKRFTLRTTLVFTTLVLSFTSLTLQAQEIDSTYTVPPPDDYIYPYPVDEVSEIVEAAGAFDFDTSEVFHIEESWFTRDYIPFVSEELIKDRIACLQNEVPLNYHDRIRSFVDFFAVERRPYTLRVMQRMNLYFPLFEKVLAEQGLPDELKYLSIIESALVPQARSWVGAQGLWQFMPGTGRMFGLKINSYVDERMDPEKATVAACKYLKSLYKTFGDWELAIAAYNCGPGNIRKAQRRTGKFHFWDIYSRLPRETRSYLPQLVAMIYVINHAEDHNLVQEQPYYSIPASEIYVSQSVDLEKLSDLLNVCESDIKQLNPELRFGTIPTYANNYPLKIPGERLMFFHANRKEIMEAATSNKKEEVVSEKGPYYYHKVRSGETLGSIAQRNAVKLSEIRSWNNIYHNRIYPGQSLKIYGPGVKQKASSKNNLAQNKVATNKPVVSSSANGKIYTVRSGDTLWQIAKKFDGLTVQKIKDLNNLTSDRLKPGQRLKVG